MFNKIIWYKSFFIVIQTILICSFAVVPATAERVLSIDDALNIARINSPEIKQLELALVRSHELLNAQNASLKSQFSLSIVPFDYRKTRDFDTFSSSWFTSESKQSYGSFKISQPIEYTDGIVTITNMLSWLDSYSDFGDTQSDTFSNNLFISFEQPVFTFNRTKLRVSELELDLENTSITYAMQLLNLEKAVAESFYGVYQTRKSLEIAKEEHENQKLGYEIVNNKVEAELAALEELYQAELNLATSKSDIQNLQVSLDNTKDSFKQLLGISLFDPVTIDADPTHHKVEVDLEKAVNFAIEHRLELRQREIAIENALFEIIQTKAINEFKGSISLSMGILGTDPTLSNVYENTSKNQSVSVSVNIPLFDWGEKKSRIKASQASLKQAELSMDDQKNDIILAVRQVCRALTNLETQIELARQNERNAELTYDINLERYKNGDLTSMDLELYQNQLSQKKQNLINVLINYKIELLNLKIQTLYDFEKDEPVALELG